MNAPGLLAQLGVRDYPAFVLVSARVAGLFLVAPLWSTAGMPRSVRAGAAVLLAVVLLPAAPPAAPLPDDMAAMAALLGAETLLGIAIGLTGALVLHGIVLAGEVTSLQMGLSLGQALGSLPEGATVGVGQLQGYLALALYLTLGGHLVLVRGLAQSLVEVPPGTAAAGLAGGREVAELAGAVFTTGVRAAAPTMVALLLANVALAILGRAVPQLNVMMVSFPVTLAVGLVVLAATLPRFGGFMADAVDRLPGLVDRTIEAFAPAGS